MGQREDNNQPKNVANCLLCGAELPSIKDRLPVVAVLLVTAVVALATGVGILAGIIGGSVRDGIILLALSLGIVLFFILPICKIKCEACENIYKTREAVGSSGYEGSETMASNDAPVTSVQELITQKWKITEKKLAEKAIPTKEEISQLPQRAIVAFAARSARRVQPLFTAPWPKDPKDHAKAVEIAISCAEGTLDQYRDASVYAVAAADGCTGVAERAADAVYAATRAAELTYAGVGHGLDDNSSAAYAAKAAKAAAEAAWARAIIYDIIDDTTWAAAKAMSSAIRCDFELLIKKAKNEKWDDYRHVLPSEFGPLWPDGKPAG